eukprot:comp18510_c0_seq1/m.19904 comp18510_c0_seq1/g.19904  ORF comp18510_c0_seq1/g.19904 comp18510_c0_seq1/m.19904 type:complete len:322 (-) comp18510_c0_seq1:37-1002(-)
MRVGRGLDTEHKDLVLYVAYDFYGQRLATCSSDHTIRVWDHDPQTGEWVLSDELKEKGHTGPVWKVVWGHPEFGQILASCSFDRIVIIWEEQVGAVKPPKWVRRTALVDSRNSVNDIEFAPKHMGLRLVTSASDGFIRVYEAIDVMNLTHWPLMEEFEAKRCTCVSWNPSRFGPPMLAVGFDDALVKICVYNEKARRWLDAEQLRGHTDAVSQVTFAPNLGRSYVLLATGSRDNTIRIWKLTDAPIVGSSERRVSSTCVGVLGEHRSPVWRLQWNMAGTVLASSGDDGTVRLWKATKPDTWGCISVVNSNGILQEIQYDPS